MVEIPLVACSIRASIVCAAVEMVQVQCLLQVNQRLWGTNRYNMGDLGDHY